jgi:hypothetical protein
MVVKLHRFLTSTLDEMRESFIPAIQKRNISAPARNRTLVVQPVVYDFIYLDTLTHP